MRLIPGEIVGVQHLRIISGINIHLGHTAQTSQLQDGVYIKGMPGIFKFSSFEIGTGSFMEFPTPMGMEFTVSLLVSCIVVHHPYMKCNEEMFFKNT